MMYPDLLPKHLHKDMTAVMLMDAMLGLDGTTCLHLLLARLRKSPDVSPTALHVVSNQLAQMADALQRNQGENQR